MTTASPSRGVSSANVRRSDVSEDDAAAAPAEPAKEDDDSALPIAAARAPSRPSPRPTSFRRGEGDHALREGGGDRAQGRQRERGRLPQQGGPARIRLACGDSNNTTRARPRRLLHGSAGATAAGQPLSSDGKKPKAR